MRRIRWLVMAAILVGMLVFGAVSVYAGWYWNSQIDVGGVDVRTVWTVDDDPNNPNGYEARIEVRVPNEADARVVTVAANERVKLNHVGELNCGNNGVEAEVRYRVEPVGAASGTHVTVHVSADGKVIGEATGTVGQNIRLDGLMISGASC